MSRLSAILRAFGDFLDPETNPQLITAADLGRDANPIIRLGAEFLDGPVAAVVPVARSVVRAVLAAVRWLDRSQARKLRQMLNVFDIAPDAFHNLREASQGRPGQWKVDQADRLRSSIP